MYASVFQIESVMMLGAFDHKVKPVQNIHLTGACIKIKEQEACLGIEFLDLPLDPFGDDMVCNAPERLKADHVQDSLPCIFGNFSRYQPSLPELTGKAHEIGGEVGFLVDGGPGFIAGKSCKHLLKATNPIDGHTFHEYLLNHGDAVVLNVIMPVDLHIDKILHHKIKQGGHTHLHPLRYHPVHHPHLTEPVVFEKNLADNSDTGQGRWAMDGIGKQEAAQGRTNDPAYLQLKSGLIVF